MDQRGSRSERWDESLPRPFAFLVSTTGWARRIHDSLGSAAYSYYFVLEAFAPLLDQLGTWRLVERPESRLPFLAAQAEAAGYRPLHLALTPPQEAYFTPAVPTLLFPFWEFPDIPDRDFGHDTRQNWARLCRSAAVIVTACSFTAAAFRRAGLTCPVAVVPVPLAPAHFALPAWDPNYRWSLECRHVVWDGLSPEPVPCVAAPALASEAPSAPRAAGWLVTRLRAGYGRVRPWLGAGMAQRLSRLKHIVCYLMGRSPTTLERLPTGRPSVGRLVYVGLRAVYRRYLRWWLSPEARARLGLVREQLYRWTGRPPLTTINPILPVRSLMLGGLVYTTVFNLGDPRKNYADLLSAFLLAFRDRPDVTLVIKLVTNPAREHHELGLLRQRYQGLGLEHQCRIVIITDYLTDEQMRDLLRVTTYYVNTSHAEGACLPLQQALAGGRPGLAPAHTAMADYMDESVGFVVRSQPEPAPWPHDPERRLETYWHRLDWSSLRDQFLASARVAERDQARYHALAAAARQRMRAQASREVAARAFREALALLPEGRTGTRARAS
jgi:glycosyltransferase involved in cell wall biosynthesis